jgi:polygalacturonase
MTNVRDFGAAGDGTTDDSEAVQHAIDEAGGDVYFPPGDYLLKRTVTARLDKCGRTSVHGSGGTAKIIMAGSGPAFRFMATHAKTADPLGFRPEEWQNERMPMIRDIEIEGRHDSADGIEIQGVMQPTLRGVLIREVRNAVRITDRARNVIISGCHFYHNTGVGVYLDKVNLHQAIIADSHISYCGRSGIRIEDSEIRNLQITGNDIEYNNAKTHEELDNEALTGEIYVDVRKGSVREGTICSNTIQATYTPNGANIRFVGHGDKANHKAGMWTITGNLIGSQAINLHLQSARGVTVTGNHMYSAHRRNVLIEDSRNIVLGANCFGHNPDYKDKEICTGIAITNSEDCVISGMLIEDCVGGQNTVAVSPRVNREASFELKDCRRVTINGVQLTNASPTGIAVSDCSDVIISSCTVLESREQTRLKHAIRWIGTGTGNMLHGCRLKTKPLIETSAGVTHTGNVIG